MLDWWCAYKPCRALEVQLVPFLELGKTFVQGRVSSLAKIRENMYLVAAADHRVMMLMASFTCKCQPRDLQNQDSPGHEAFLQIGSWGSVWFLEPQIAPELAHTIKIQELLASARRACAGFTGITAYGRAEMGSRKVFMLVSR